MKEQLLMVSNDLNKKIETTETLNKHLFQISQEIGKLSPETIKKYKRFVTPQNNLLKLINFYENFLKFLSLKDRIINRLSPFNNSRDLPKEITPQEIIYLEEYNKLQKEVESIKKYSGINMVDSELLNIKKVDNTFVTKIQKLFFKLLREKFFEVDEKLKFFSYFLIEIKSKDFMSLYVSLVTECYLNSVCKKTPREILEEFEEEMGKLRKLSNLLLPEKERKSISLQIDKTIPISIMPTISEKLYLWNQQNNWRVLTDIFYIYKLIVSDGEVMKFYKVLLPEIRNTINNLTIELQKQLGVEKTLINENAMRSLLKSIANSIYFSTKNPECFLLGRNKKIRDENELKTFFEKRLYLFFSKIKFSSEKEIVKNLGFLVILKGCYENLENINLLTLIDEGTESLLDEWSKYLKKIKIKENQTEFEIIDGLKKLVDTNKNIIVSETFRETFVKKLTKRMKEETKIYSDVLDSIFKDLYKKK
ncbi:hypothetical protein CDIK_1384 [Cucumispora dikerogammari]|nr:hypothetical protein CDIK_1384 [Cucumispora dikerogammari]